MDNFFYGSLAGKYHSLHMSCSFPAETSLFLTSILLSFHVERNLEDSLRIALGLSVQGESSKLLPETI